MHRNGDFYFLYKMVAVRHLEFVGQTIWTTDKYKLGARAGFYHCAKFDCD